MNPKIKITPYLMMLAFLVIITGWTAAFADGLIVVPRPFHQPHPYPRPPHPPTPPSPFPLDVVYHRVQVTIEDLIATTHIEQSFYNPTSLRLEGYYIFPIPSGALLKDFTMLINGQKVHAELLDAKKARRLYEDIVRQMRDPALLEYSGQGLFKVRIYPIEPRSEKEITITYYELLASEFDTVEYLYPLNTEKFSAKPLKDVSIDVSIKTSKSISTIYCPSHEVDIARKSDTEARVSFEQRNVKPDTDFKLYFGVNSSDIAMTLLTYRSHPENGFFFLNISPSLNYSRSKLTSKDITFVLDVSGSMAGAKLKHAKKALLYCVDNLAAEDRFQIIRFSTEAYSLFKNLADVTDEKKEQAYRFIEELHPVGGTAIDEALQLALSSRRESTRRPHMVIFITDGKPTIGETNEDKLIEKIEQLNDKRTRIFTFGIGEEINTHLLDKITEVTKATRTYISPSEDIEIKISQFFDKVQSPVLTDLSLEYCSSIEILQTYPKDLPDLFKGSSITLFGRYRGQGDCRLSVKGNLQDSPQSFSIDGHFVRNDTGHDFIPYLWATRRIGHLLDLTRLHGEDKELIDEITELARNYGIVTPYTSYLIMEDESIKTAHRELREEHQTLGWIGSRDRVAKRALESEYAGIKTKSGRQSVQVSKDFKAMNEAVAIPGMIQGGQRLSFNDSDGSMLNISEQVKNIQGRAMYQNGNFWIDAHLQSRKPQKTVRIQFATHEYFDLLKKEPEAAQFLALGQNVRFIVNATYYEIYE